MSEQYPDSPFPPHYPADRHCLWYHHCHPKHSNRHSGLEDRSRPHAVHRVHAQ